MAMIDALEAAGQDRARQNRPDRADLRQYRHRPGFCGRGARLQAHTGHAGIHVDRAAQDARSSGRRTGADAGGARHEGRDRQGRRTGRRDARRDHPRAIRKSGQSRQFIAAPPPRKSGTTPNGEVDIVDFRRRHRGHHHRRRPGSESAQAGRENGRGRAGRIARPVRRPARTPQDSGHRRRLRAAGSRFAA